MPQWISLPPEDARLHRLYGFRGWLIAIYVLVLVLFLLDLRSITGDSAMMKMMFETEAQVAVIRWVMIFECVALLPFLVLTPLKHSVMPTAALAGFAAFTLLRPLAVLLLIDIKPVKIMAVSGNHLVLGAVFIAYVLLSKRVNVTFRHRVKAG